VAGNALRLIEFLGRMLGKAMYEGEAAWRAFVASLGACCSMLRGWLRAGVVVAQLLPAAEGLDAACKPDCPPATCKGLCPPTSLCPPLFPPPGILVELPLAPFFLKKFRGAYCDINDLPTLDPELYRCGGLDRVLCVGWIGFCVLVGVVDDLLRLASG